MQSRKTFQSRLVINWLVNVTQSRSNGKCRNELKRLIVGIYSVLLVFHIQFLQMFLSGLWLATRFTLAFPLYLLSFFCSLLLLTLFRATFGTAFWSALPAAFQAASRAAFRTAFRTLLELLFELLSELLFRAAFPNCFPNYFPNSFPLLFAFCSSQPSV